MDNQTLLRELRTLNESELFYRSYRLAKASPAVLGDFLGKLDPAWVRELQLIIPEWPDTVIEEYTDEQFFPTGRGQGIAVSKHNCYTPAVPHRHNFFEMFYVLEGQCVHQIRDHSSILRAGDLCLIQPSVTHAVDVGDESILLDVLIRRSTFRHYFYSLLQGDNLLANFFLSTVYARQGIDYLILHTAADGELRDSFLKLWGEYREQGDYCTVLLNAILTQIFVRLLRSHMAGCELPERQEQDSRVAIRIARYLQLNTATATLANLAEEFHYSPEYTSRLVKQSTGQSFIRLLTQVRMENAVQLLRDTSLPVADIAAHVGYESSEHFIRTFRRQKGLTPSEYRKQKR